MLGSWYSPKMPQITLCPPGACPPESTTPTLSGLVAAGSADGTSDAEGWPNRLGKSLAISSAPDRLKNPTNLMSSNPSQTGRQAGPEIRRTVMVSWVKLTGVSYVSGVSELLQLLDGRREPCQWACPSIRLSRFRSLWIITISSCFRNIYKQTMDLYRLPYMVTIMISLLLLLIHILPWTVSFIIILYCYI